MIIDSKAEITAEAYEVTYQKLSGFRQFDIPMTMLRETGKKMELKNEEYYRELTK